MYVKSFRELRVYKTAKELAKRIFELTKTFPQEEKYSITSQVRKSSRSIGAQIAEAWAKRRYAAHFVSKLTDADGEQQETQHWLEVALDCEYIPLDVRDDLVRECEDIGKMIFGMIDKANSFCGNELREVPTDYPTEATDY